MRRALYASGGLHALVLAWAIVEGAPSHDSEDIPFEVTGVTLMSVAEFEALSAPEPTPAPPPAPLPQVVETPVALQPAEDTAPPEPPAPEESAPEAPETAAITAPETEIAPDVTALQPLPEAEVTDELAGLAAPEQDLLAPPSDQPSPRQVPRVAPLPAPAPPPEADIAPEVVERAAPSEDAETPTPDQPPAAPEEATTEIVTEAEEPARAIAPLASVRPTARPTRPPVAAPDPAPEPEADPETDPAPADDPLAAAIAAAVADATTPPEPPARPLGPPLTSGERDGLRVAVQTCWNVGSLSSEALETVVTISVQMGQDGRPDTGSIEMIEFSGGSQDAARQAFEAARRAVIRCGTSGYNLPVEKYEQWRTIEITFNPEEMRLR